MALPELDVNSRKRPISYDPSRDKFILLEDVLLVKENIVPVDLLAKDDVKKLIINRWLVLPKETKVSTLNGLIYSRDDVIRAIEDDEPFGLLTVEAEKNYLRYINKEILSNINIAPPSP